MWPTAAWWYKFSFSRKSSRQPNFTDVRWIVNVRWLDDRRTAAGQRGSEIETRIDWSTWTSNELIESIVNKRKYLKIVCHPILLSTSDSLSIPPEWVCVAFMLSFLMLTWTNKRFMRNWIDTEKELSLWWKSKELQSLTLSRFACLDYTCVVWTSSVPKSQQLLHLFIVFETTNSWRWKKYLCKTNMLK